MRREDDHAIAAGQPAQCAALTSLVNRIYAASEGDIWLAGAAFERTSEEEMERLLRAEEILVGTRGGVVVGCIRWHFADSEQRVAEFGMLCVDEESRHMGLGSRLVRAAELAATAAGCRMIECELLVPRDGPHAAKDQMRSWYPSLGYSLAADRTRPFEEIYPSLVKSFGLKRPSDCYFYEKALGEN